MNLDKLFAWIVGIVIACAGTEQLDGLQAWIWQAQAQVIYESRSSNWGSPRFFHEHKSRRLDSGFGASSSKKISKTQ